MKAINSNDMVSRTITLKLPESLFIRLEQASRATKQTLDEIILRAVRAGSPPDWDDVPAEFQTDISSMDRLDDTALWRVAKSKSTETEMRSCQELLDKRADGTITSTESEKLKALQTDFDRLMLCKAHAASLLRWRGYTLFKDTPPP